MQETRRTNAERTLATRTALVAAARALFVDPGYAEASTPQIAAAAHVTRGALYHHYADKRDLFRAVVEAEAEAVAREIEARTGPPARTAPRTSDAPESPDAPDARGLLVEGARAYLDAMAVPGRTRLLLVDAPAVLGAAEADALDARHARRTLRAGLAAALDIAPDQERTREGSARDHGTRRPTAGPRHEAHPAPERPSPVPAREHGPTAPRVTDDAADDAALDIAHDDRLDALTLLLSAAFDRAALALDGGAPPHPVRAAVTELVDRVCAPRTTR
ncbi:TetR/AcrR family transcriptional regulator [Cellulosimicrobium sp. SH8]|uniref:TetR/AcrR family transcriptional regulator n=1 Tax=Cellulosimicrobium sp. SH8 TaxID=2952936 RepID=UPI0021F299AB|nr:TetR/AcrR family transcriptional regulator [Cellulosimicrobium sp. SH8]